jgi:trimethylamine:corrinoid methyltransferase-like protein
MLSMYLAGPMARTAAWTGLRAVTTTADSHFIVTATGPDRVGIVMDIAKAILGRSKDRGGSDMSRARCMIEQYA